MDTFFQKILGGVGRLQVNVGVTLFHQWRSRYPRMKGILQGRCKALQA